MSTMWWDKRYDRYQKEVNALRGNFPAVQLQFAALKREYCPVCQSSSGAIPVHLTALMSLTTRVGRIYPVMMVYPCDFPYRIPQVWPTRPLDPRPPAHMYGDGRLCLTSNDFDPQITGSQVLSWTYGWLNCYDIWLRTGTFPPRNYGIVRV